MATMKEAVLAVMKDAEERGRYPILSVASPDKFTLKSDKDGGLLFTFDHAGAAAELGTVLSAMKVAGEWADKGGTWSWALKSKAQVNLTGRSSKSSKVTPAPAPKSFREQLKSATEEQSKAEQELQRCKSEVERLTPLAAEEQKTEDAARLEQTKAAANALTHGKPEDVAAILSDPTVRAALLALLKQTAPAAPAAPNGKSKSKSVKQSAAPAPAA